MTYIETSRDYGGFANSFVYGAGGLAMAFFTIIITTDASCMKLLHKKNAGIQLMHWSTDVASLVPMCQSCPGRF